MPAYTDVLFSEIPGEGGDLGVITLNRANVLNSLDHDMVHAMYAQLCAWEMASHIKAVVICAAEGRAFCAGGDLRLTYERIKNHDPIMTHFFRDEYQLNLKIYHYPKPYIALLDGITMGGGVGISIHGSHRVATERLLFAMPETGIGFFPDVGGSYFLPRLKGYIGYYLGLSGARINSDDCMQIGIANHKMAAESIPQCIQALAQQTFGSDPHLAVSTILHAFHVPSQASSLIEHQAKIDACFSAPTIEAILFALEQSEEQWCKEAAVNIAKKSPTSLKVSLKAMQNGKELDFDACMRQEFRLVSHFLQGHDFAEGIRAVIIDKDQKPRWEPNTLEHVTHELVNTYFEPLYAELV